MTIQTDLRNSAFFVQGQYIGQETRNLEYKDWQGNLGYKKEEIAQNIVAFMNTDGGNLLIGVDNAGRVVGRKYWHEDRDRLVLTVDAATRSIIPLVLTEIKPVFIPVHGGQQSDLAVVRISVEAWNDTTTVYRTRDVGVFVRREASKQGPLSQDQISQLILSRQNQIRAYALERENSALKRENLSRAYALERENSALKRENLSRAYALERENSALKRELGEVKKGAEEFRVRLAEETSRNKKSKVCLIL